MATTSPRRPKRHGHWTWAVDHDDVICERLRAGGTLAVVSIAVGVVVPLVSAVLAALVAWLVAWRQGQTAREHWILDKRYEMYARILETGLRLIRGDSLSSVRRQLRNGEQLEEFLSPLIALNLVAPKDVRVPAGRVGELAADASASGKEADIEAFMTALRDLLDHLREDLLPRRLK